jgi:putative aldouronate transport system substrate-binding protein
MKRYLICLLGLSCLALLSCGRGGSTTVSPQAEENLDPLGKYDPPITLSWGINSSSVQKFFDRTGVVDTYANNPWSRRYRDDMGINLTVGFTADGATGAYDNQLNLALASGDLPDVLRISNYRVFKEAVDAGYLADLTDIYDKYAGEWLQMVRDRYPSAFNYATIDGRLYGIPPFNGNEQFANLLWIRDDWLNNLNLKAPTTIEELIETARAFTFNDPDGNGRKDTFGLGLHNRLVTNDHCTLTGFFGAWGVPAFQHAEYFLDGSGKTTFSYIQPAMKEALKTLQQMYREGLIDPEFSVKDSSKLADEVGEGRIGMAYGPQWGTWYPWNNVMDNYGVITHPYAIPAQAGYAPKLGYESNTAAGEIIVISSRVKNPEAIIKMINFSITVSNDWMSDEDRELYNNSEQWRFNPVQIGEPQEVRVGPLIANALLANDPSTLAPGNQRRYNLCKEFEAGTDRGSEAYGQWGQYSLQGSMYVIMNKYVPEGWLVESIRGAQWPDSLITHSASLEKITEQALTEIITGAPVEARFDQYVQDWLRAGGRQVLDEFDVQMASR